MENKTEEEASNLVNLYQEILQETNSEPVAIAILQEIGKTQRAVMCNQSDKRESPRDSSSSLPATDKQIGLMKVLKLVIPDGVTKTEASRLIDKAQGKM